MTDRTGWQDEPDLERMLADLDARIAYPEAPDLAGRVGARLLSEGVDDRRLSWVARRSPARPGRGLHRGIALVALVLALLSGAILAFFPEARVAVARWFGLQGVIIVNAPHVAPPRPVGASLQLGRRLTLAMAQARVSYQVMLPRLPDLITPDEVYLGAPPPGGQVSLVYRARRDLPRANTTGVGLLLTEFRGDVTSERFAFRKGMEPGTRLELVTVNGSPGYWITGQSHLFWYTNGSGMLVHESVRLAGNVLLWERSGLTLRLESALGRDAALRIAAAVR